MTLVTDHLTQRGVQFEVVPHPRAFTSLAEAREVGVSADAVAKTVALRSHGRYVLAVVPASRRLDMRMVHTALGDPAARLATEAELVADFPGYELGALPPLASLLGTSMVVDPDVFGQETLLFAAGVETESVKARTDELFRGEPMTVRPLVRHAEPAGEEPVIR
jgi:Ala-tRNA(Pro) deacylase